MAHPGGKEPESIKNLIIKGNDGEPLLRKTIQYDLLQAIFNDTTKCFTDVADPYNKINFSTLYRNTLLNSTKMTGSQRVKMEQFPEFGMVMAQVCLLVNVGRINTTLAFYPDMRTALRYYHSIPSLQRDETTRQHMYDAARMKTVLKGCVSTDIPLILPKDILARQAAGAPPPICNPVVALFAFSSNSITISNEHFKEEPLFEFADLFLPASDIYSSASRARAFLWLLYRYIEDSKGTNPFSDPSVSSNRGGKWAPRLEKLSKEDAEKENVDTPEEVDYGKRMFQYRVEFLTKTEAEYAQHQDSPQSGGKGIEGSRGQKAIKKKAAMSRAAAVQQGDILMASLETSSNFSRDSSMAPPPVPSTHDLPSHMMSGALAPVVTPQQTLLLQSEQNARQNLSQPSSVSLVNHAMNHMISPMIDSEDEDNESYMQMILDRRLAVLNTFCSY